MSGKLQDCQKNQKTKTTSSVPSPACVHTEGAPPLLSPRVGHTCAEPCFACPHCVQTPGLPRSARKGRPRPFSDGQAGDTSEPDAGGPHGTSPQWGGGAEGPPLSPLLHRVPRGRHPPHWCTQLRHRDVALGAHPDASCSSSAAGPAPHPTCQATGPQRQLPGVPLPRPSPEPARPCSQLPPQSPPRPPQQASLPLPPGQQACVGGRGEQPTCHFRRQVA